MKARRQEGAVLSTAAFVHAELMVVPSAVARRQEDVHQWVLCTLRVPPACKTDPNTLKGTGELLSPPWSPRLGQLKDSTRLDNVFRACSVKRVALSGLAALGRNLKFPPHQMY